MKKENKKITIDLWIFYVLTVGIVMLIASVVMGWMSVAKLKNIEKQLEDRNKVAVVQTVDYTRIA